MSPCGRPHLLASGSLGDCLLVLVFLDLNVIARIVQALYLGKLLSAVGLEGLGVGLALMRVPLLLVLLWLTLVAWRALRES